MGYSKHELSLGQKFNIVCSNKPYNYRGFSDTQKQFHESKLDETTKMDHSAKKPLFCVNFQEYNKQYICILTQIVWKKKQQMTTKKKKKRTRKKAETKFISFY